MECGLGKVLGYDLLDLRQTRSNMFTIEKALCFSSSDDTFRRKEYSNRCNGAGSQPSSFDRDVLPIVVIVKTP